jgi:lipoprotein NlpI
MHLPNCFHQIGFAVSFIKATLTASTLTMITAPLVAAPAEPAEQQRDSPQHFFEQAVQLFFEGKPEASAQLFDTLINQQPDLAPRLWQRGLALYYAGRYDDGRRQFELHRTVNPNDVENTAWHYLCVARGTTPDHARTIILPVGHDARLPMQEILALYRGDGTETDVIAAARSGDAGQRRNQLCYTHLYLGLYAEANGDTVAAKDHMLKAAGPYSMNHYMGRVAKLHILLRGWNLPANETCSAPQEEGN